VNGLFPGEAMVWSKEVVLLGRNATVQMFTTFMGSGIIRGCRGHTSRVDFSLWSRGLIF